MEIWRDVPSYNGRYQISIDTKEGKCRLVYQNGTIKEIKNKITRIGRIFWKLSLNGKRTTYQAARWIAITYPELVQSEYFEGAEIDHIDTDRLNNHPSNLRWVTKKENMNNPLTKKNASSAALKRFKTHPAFKGENHPMYGKKHTEDSKKKMSLSHKGKINHSWCSIPVSQYTLDGTYIATYASARQAERETGVNNAAISRCCKGKVSISRGRNYVTKSAGGYIWSYAS